MKKLLAVLLSVVMLVTLFVMPVSADTTGTGVLTYSMTESEFRTFTYDNGFSSQMTMNLQSNGSADSKDYYYNVLKEQASDSLAFDVYNTAVDESDSFLSGEWEITIDTDIFNGERYDESPDSDFYILAQRVDLQALIGMWCYRYDNVLETDRFTNTVYAQVKCLYNPKTNIISQSKIVVLCMDHPYYNESEIEQRDNVIDEIVNIANSKSNQYEALKYIHNTLALGAEYDYDALTANSDSQNYYYAHSALGILTKGKGVCESYAKAFKEICDRLTFYTQVAVLTSETHMWNIVKLNGKWYCVDVTWDDFGGDAVDYTYFLCGDPDIIDGNSYDHVPDGIFTIPPVYADDYYTQSDILSGWQKIDGDIYYFYNGEAVTGWFDLDGNRYCFDRNGVILTGLVNIDRNNYYFNSNGIMQTGFVKIDGGIHYFDADGKMHTGWLELDGNKYYFGYPTGIMYTGLVNINGNTYYFNSIGIMQTGFIDVYGNTFYFDQSGVMKTGWIDVDGNWYYSDQRGIMQTGWVYLSRWYYFDENGIMQTGWVKTNGNWYFLDSDGARVTGLWYIYDDIFYFDADGVMQTGWHKIYDTWYYFNTDGRMATGWINLNGTWYFLDSDGAMLTGWQKISGTWYYMNSSGAMLTGWQKISGTWYYMNSGGAMLTGWVRDGGSWYYMSPSGAMKTGWVYDGGSWYYMNSGGAMLTGWVRDGGSWYYMSPSGAMKTGWLLDGGKWYYLKSNGVMATNTYISGGYINASGVWS